MSISENGRGRQGLVNVSLMAQGNEDDAISGRKIIRWASDGR